MSMARIGLGVCGLLLLASCSRRSVIDAGATPAATAAAGAPAALAAAPVAGTGAAGAAPAAPAPPPLSYEQRLGRDVYQRYCQVCHGERGGGDGFNAFNLDPHPRDFSDPVFQNKKSDADLADAVRRGGAGVGLTSLMPPWGRTLSGRQVDSVVLYLRTLRKSPS
jgi:mono/diheme cytochrome c family protein